MAIIYKAVPKKNPLNLAQPVKYYPQVITTGAADLRELAGEISQMSTVSSTDTVAVVEALLNIIPTTLGSSRIVRLGDFGTFSLSVSGEGAATPEEVSSQHIQKLSVNFRPGKVFLEALNKVPFKKTGQ
jgi:predicted histone-like DNA-binding protein